MVPRPKAYCRPAVVAVEKLDPTTRRLVTKSGRGLYVGRSRGSIGACTYCLYGRVRGGRADCEEGGVVSGIERMGHREGSDPKHASKSVERPGTG